MRIAGSELPVFGSVWYMAFWLPFAHRAMAKPRPRSYSRRGWLGVEVDGGGTWDLAAL